MSAFEYILYHKISLINQQPTYRCQSCPNAVHILLLQQYYLCWRKAYGRLNMLLLTMTMILSTGESS